MTTKDGGMPVFSPGWTVIDHNAEGAIAIQWDGGPNYSVHGQSQRVLPAITIPEMVHYPQGGRPEITFELLAEGYKREIAVPVNFLMEGQPHLAVENEVAEWL
jgi:hypothetical protein